MEFNLICPKCKRVGINIWHFHEPDFTGIQAIIHHNKEIRKDLFGNEHKYFIDACFLTEEEYKKLNLK